MTQRAAALLLLCGLLCAQTPTATIVGIVTDPAGSLVTGAQVEVRNTGTNELRKAQSDAKGEFVVPNLNPGSYDLSVIKDGFRTLRQTGLTLQVDQQARLEFHLELGSVSQKVEVTASVPLINTENSVKGDVVTTEEMMEMPLINRDFTDLAFLTPGVLPSAQASGSAPMEINGARAADSNFLVDGFNARDPRDASAQVHPNLDAVQEFKMEVSGYSADTGRMSGGVMTIVLKTGTNRLHGSLFEFFRNDALNARNFFDAASPSVLRLNRYGAVIDGPIYIPKLYDGRNRTFFLFSWESFRQNTPSPALSLVPTVAQRQGSFGTSAIKDPLAAGALFPNNQIPASRMSSQALAAEQYFPSPNLTGQKNNYYADTAAPAGQDNFAGKIDQRVTDADHLSFRFVKNYRWSLAPYNSGNTGAFGLNGGDHLTVSGLTYTRTIKPTVISEFRFGYSRTFGSYVGVHAGTDYNKLFGMPGGTTDPARVGFPLFNITNYDLMGDSVGWPNIWTSNNYTASETLTWVKGSHLIKLGGDVVRYQIFQPSLTNVRGTYVFTGSWTGQPYADFLLGTMNSDSRSVDVGSAMSYWLYAAASAFVQDDWKVSSRLTLNLGLRYELPNPMHEKYGRLTNFIPELNKVVIGSDKGIASGVNFGNASQVETAQQAGLPSSLVYPTRKDFAPRFGFAWRPFGGNRTALRGGYGIFYGVAGPWVNLYQALSAVFPFVLTQSINRNAADPNFLTLANPFPVSPNLVSNVTSVSGFQLHQRTPYAQNWNLTVERSLGSQSAIEIGYSGAKGTHLARMYNLNQPYDRSAALPGGIVPYPQWGTTTYYAFGFDSSYNAGSVTLRRRFTRDFFYRLNYTYAKSIDDASQLLGNSAGGYAGVQDTQNFRLERGRSDFSMGHVFTMSLSWVAPWRHNLLTRGWQLAGTGIARTGSPFTPQVSNVNLNLGEANRPNRIAKGTVSSPSATRWFDLSGFPPVATGAYGDGNSGRNILDGPGFVGINLALYRNFTVRESQKVQFRWEVFNALNHTNFNLPVVNVNAPNAATITTAGASRQMQLALKYSF